MTHGQIAHNQNPRQIAEEKIRNYFNKIINELKKELKEKNKLNEFEDAKQGAASVFYHMLNIWYKISILSERLNTSFSEVLRKHLSLLDYSQEEKTYVALTIHYLNEVLTGDLPENFDIIGAYDFIIRGKYNLLGLLELEPENINKHQNKLLYELHDTLDKTIFLTSA